MKRSVKELCIYIAYFFEVRNVSNLRSPVACCFEVRGYLNSEGLRSILGVWMSLRFKS